MIIRVSYTYALSSYQLYRFENKWYHMFIMHAPVQTTDLGSCGKLFF